LAGLFAQFESDRPSGLFCRAAARSAVYPLAATSSTRMATATKLAVDCQIKHGKVASTAFDLEFRPDRRQTCLGRSGGFCTGEQHR
jgi:hypothetical protein